VDARHLAFQADSFDIAICGFMGWYDCYDFARGVFKRPDTKASEIWRVLRDGGRFVCCSWEAQEGVTWMEEQVLRYYPAILEDSEYLEKRPLGMAYEKAEDYNTILQAGGFTEVQVLKETVTFVSTDEEEWWQQMLFLDWDPFLKKLEDRDSDELQRVKTAILSDLQRYKHADGIHFDKTVFFVHAAKSA
jgi:ubiquinone/menaquinone biosynthesis C-methylase UbiE